MSASLLATSDAASASASGAATLPASASANGPKAAPNGIFLDDASRMSRRQVQRYIEARSEADVLEAFQLAQRLGIPITARGKAHAMGGHSMGPGIVLSLRHMSQVTVDVEGGQLTAQAGATWAEVLQAANRHARSVPTLQSYAGFSLGGSIAVNIHGVSSDATLVESILALRVLTADGRILDCSHPSLQQDQEAETTVLFRHVVGGLGLFGIVLSATLRLCPNVLLDSETMLLTPTEFDYVHTQVREAPDVELKLARLDIASMDSIQLFVFRRASGPTVSPLPTKPRAAGPVARLIFKWLAPTALEMRFALERQLGGALDWSNDVLQRNLLLFESVDPLAVLFNPLLEVDDTFVLQEYFVPRRAFADWVQGAKPIYRDVLENKDIWLLNTTVRFVKHDTCSALPYAVAEDGMYAFVLYFRIRRTADVEAQLAVFHRRLLRLTLGLNGRPYLAYRHHFSDEELRQAYPEFKAFCAAKLRLDPRSRFTNTWFERYGTPKGGAAPSVGIVGPSALFYVPENSAEGLQPPQLRQTEERHEGSFRAVLGDQHLRRHFREHFLKDIFNVKEPAGLYSLIAQATWDRRNATDIDIYIALQQLLSRNSGPVASILSGWRGIKQLSAQKEQLVSELSHVLSMVGRSSGLHGYVSIGDHGKLVLPIRAKLDLQGPVYILHDMCSEDIPAVLERGSLDAPGTFIVFNTETLYGFGDVPAGSADLVTMMQGLHHLPQTAVTPFLNHVYRILRPGGLFVFREHNLDPDTHKGLRPMLDVAHMVFNAVTGVSVADEKTERRAFRSILEWRQIAEAHGLIDTRVYGMQENDPTFDEMIVCFKPPFAPPERTSAKELHRLRSVAPKTPISSMPVVLPGASAAARAAPGVAIFILHTLVDGLREGLPEVSAMLQRQMSGLSSNQQLVLQQLLQQYVQPFERFLARFEPLLAHSASKVRSGDGDSASDTDAFNFLPAELGLIAPALMKKVERGQASPLECTAAALIKDLENIFTFQPREAKGSANPRNAPGTLAGQNDGHLLSPHDPVHGGVDPGTVADELDKIVEAFPVLGTPEAIENLGLPRLLQRAANAYYDNVAADLDDGQTLRQAIAKRLAFALNESTWTKLRQALRRAREAGAPPLWSSVLVDDDAGQNAWHQALCILFESPRFRLPMQLRGTTARFLGCRPILQLWEKVRQEQKTNAASADDGMAQSDDAAHEAMSPLPKAAVNAMTYLRAQEQVQEETLRAPFRSIKNIRRLVSVRFGYTSLTASKIDITVYARQHWLVGTTLQLDNVDVLGELRAAGLWTGQAGLGQAYDSMRMRLTGKAHKLHISFAPLGGADELEHCRRLSLALREACLTDAEHAEDGHYTWFKLVEWMQVEILQEFGASLEHTPWYRLPLLGLMRRYFSVFGKVLKIVREKHGLGPAYFSTAMLTDLVPGIVMSAVFGQLTLLSLPLRAMYGEKYEAENMVEELVVLDRSGEESDRLLEELRDVARHVDLLAPRLFRLIVPTFKALTTAVLKVARRWPQLQLIDISGQAEVQVKVAATVTPAAADVEKAKLNHEQGVKVMFSYTLPLSMPDCEASTHISLGVAVPCLCDLVRYVDTRPSLTVEQIYDFWR